MPPSLSPSLWQAVQERCRRSVAHRALAEPAVSSRSLSRSYRQSDYVWCICSAVAIHRRLGSSSCRGGSSGNTTSALISSSLSLNLGMNETRAVSARIRRCVPTDNRSCDLLPTSVRSGPRVPCRKPFDAMAAVAACLEEQLAAARHQRRAGEFSSVWHWAQLACIYSLPLAWA